jgi:hypothetical protein
MQRMLRNVLSRTLPLLLGLGLLTAMGPSHPGLAQGADDALAQVTVVYTSDIKGHIEPCG